MKNDFQGHLLLLYWLNCSFKRNASCLESLPDHGLGAGIFEAEPGAQGLSDHADHFAPPELAVPCHEVSDLPSFKIRRARFTLHGAMQRSDQALYGLFIARIRAGTLWLWEIGRE